MAQPSISDLRSAACLNKIQVILENLAHNLPSQGPIKDFIHHNTLHAFQHLHFDEALEQASQFYAPQPSLLDTSIQSILIRLVSGFLDQGIALSPFPELEYSFFEALKHLTEHSWLPLAYFTHKKRTRTYFQKSPEQVCSDLLTKLAKSEDNFESYITRTIMTQRGWAGMIYYIETHPESLLFPRKIRLIEFLALKLILEWEYHLYTGLLPYPVDRKPQPSPLSDLKNLEDRYYHQVLSLFTTPAPLKPYLSPKIQAILCIDDREAAFMRHIEKEDQNIEVFNTAGFFGMDFFFQSLNDASPKKLCPAPIKPKHLIHEKPHPEYEAEFSAQKKMNQRTARWRKKWDHDSASLLIGFLAANMLGHLSFFRLIKSFLNPTSLSKAILAERICVKTELNLHRKEEKHQDIQNALHCGFSYDEMTERVFSVLKNMGLTDNFASLIAIIAHGSSSLNNPHFAAYDCGACSGNPGAPNARAFASIANLKEVRLRLAAKGIHVPEQTYFIGGFHDTCSDAVNFFDTQDLSAQHSLIFSDFLKTLEIAKQKNARERCQQFELVHPNISAQEALLEVQNRSVFLFEPRPELGHALNSLCIVGRRFLTKELDFERRAFINSYNPTQDLDGCILNQILNAIIPVCGGINLEYYFSQQDNAIYGCGTKLSHNVCSLIGVYNGIDDDLRTGLPIQMVELHEPIRILFIIEQDYNLVKNVIQNNTALWEWVHHEWVKMACIHPDSHHIHFFKRDSGFVEYPL